MTPTLILLFGVTPSTAVSSDVVAAVPAIGSRCGGGHGVAGSRGPSGTGAAEMCGG